MDGIGGEGMRNSFDDGNNAGGNHRFVAICSKEREERVVGRRGGLTKMVSSGRTMDYILLIS